MTTSTGSIDRDAPRRFVERLRALTPEQWQALARSLDHLRGDDIGAVWRRARHKALLVATLPGLQTLGALVFSATELVSEFSPRGNPLTYVQGVRRVAREGQHELHARLDLWELCEITPPGDQLVADVCFHAAIMIPSRAWWLPNHHALYAPLEPFIPAASV